MPPRKVDSAAKNVEKRPRGRKKIVKDVLKIPSLVKLKFKLPGVKTVQNLENEDVNLDAVDKAKKPAIRKRTVVKKQGVKKKNQNGEQTKNMDVPVKKRTKAKSAVNNENTVNANDAIEEDNSLILNNHFIKTLMANQVVNFLFAKKSKHTENIPGDPVLQEPTTTAKEQPNKTVLKRKICNSKGSAINHKGIKAKRCSETKIPRDSKNATRAADINVNVSKVNKQSVGRVTQNKAIKKKPVAISKAASKMKVLNAKAATTTLPKINNKCGRPKKLPITNTLNDNMDINNVTSNTESKDNKNKTNRKKINGEVSQKRKRSLNINRKNLKTSPNSQEKLDVCEKDKQTYNTKERDIKEKCSLKSKASEACSNMSWIKDISSSSNSSTVVTSVNSKDFYFFDNKMPVLQLTNIDKRILINNDKHVRATKPCIEGPTSIVDKNRLIQETVIETDKQLISSRKSCISNSNPVTKLNLSLPNGTENVNTKNKENISMCSSKSFSTSSTSSSSSSSSSSSTSNSLCTANEQRSVSSNGKKKDKKTALEKLSLNLKIYNHSKTQFYQNSNENTNRAITVNNMQDNVFRDDILQYETDLCCLCIALKKLEIDDVDKYFNHSELKNTNDVSHPITPVVLNAEEYHTTTEHQNSCEKDYTQNTGNIKELQEETTNGRTEKSDDNCFSYNKTKATSFDDDDDDTLSLFAESFTESVSYRRNSILNSEFPQCEEYIPQPIIANKVQSCTVSYQPTKISSTTNIDNEIQQCSSPLQIQNENSTLIENNNKFKDKQLFYEDRAGDLSQNTLRLPLTVTKNTRSPSTPRLMASIHKPIHGRKSRVFKGCFYNLSSTCHNPNCKFSHVYLNTSTVEISLKKLSEELFIQEYMLMRTWYKLKRRYGLCFVEECMRRELTRILVEMAIDFTVKPVIPIKNSTEFRNVTSEVVDNVLMYLNKYDLSACDDLLRYNLITEKKLLCDYFMTVIATSQNFSRFKPIFVKLTDFIYQNGRTFSVDVAESVLERLCILPYEESLARSLMKILKNTQVTVFYNGKISDFERQLVTSNNNLYHEFKLLKDQVLANQPIRGYPYETLNEAFCDEHSEPDRNELHRNELHRNELHRNELHRSEPHRNELLCNESLRKEALCNESLCNKSLRNEPLHNEAFRNELLRNELLNNESFQNQVVGRTGSGHAEKNVIRQESPDLSNVNNRPVVTKFTRTINLDKLKQLGFNVNTINDSEKSTPPKDPVMGGNTKNMYNVEILRNGNTKNTTQLNENISRWRKNFEMFCNGPRWAPLKRHSNLSYEGSAPKFKRNNGPNFYHREML